jgi:predicted tellurium resistance membrane protein TerC
MGDLKYEMAKKRVEELKDFYGHLTAYIIVIAFLGVINLLTSPTFWWFLFVAFFWGIGLIAHAASVFLKRGIFSKEWEEKKIRKYMEEEERNQR